MPETTTDTASVSLPPELLSQFYEEAATAVGDLAGAVARVADRFRQNDVKPANELLSALPAELRNFIVMISVVDGQLGIARSALIVDGLAPPEQIARLGEWLASLVEAQANDDTLTIADILELDLVPFLRAWQELLAGCQR